MIGVLVCTHPCGIVHGGLMRLGEWKEQYWAVKGELERRFDGWGREDGIVVDSSADEEPDRAGGGVQHRR